MKLLKFNITQCGHVLQAWVQALPHELDCVLAQPGRPIPDDGSEACLFTFCKLFKKDYYIDGMEFVVDQDCWLISGYGNDDVNRVLLKLGIMPRKCPDCPAWEGQPCMCGNAMHECPMGDDFTVR